MSAVFIVLYGQNDPEVASVHQSLDEAIRHSEDRQKRAAEKQEYFGRLADYSIEEWPPGGIKPVRRWNASSGKFVLADGKET